ncbi:putative MFS-type transporter YttB [Catellatospora sp. TT07R-123]|uniref:MFS transporter n=1 Tax=Catellatospora sp. TT07R-123 TaxID=2733863 RepID=UPI001B1E800C|nr:MFS transporter [Catellatospora sp. TT07R-123]GHJ46964.1 putative MFS-type transporter YttB [Catellatospora sp. TT07R-123]
MRDIPRIVWILAVGRFVNAAGSFVFTFLFLYLTGPRALSLTQAGLISGALGVGLLAGNLTGGWFGDRYGHRRILLLASTVAGVVTLLVPWTPVALLAVSTAVLGYSGATAGTAQGALTALAVPTGDRRRAVAIGRAAFNAGCVIGPPLGALLAVEHFTALFVIDGLVLLAVRAATALLLRAEPAPAAPSARALPRLWPTLRTDRALLALLPAIVVMDVVYRQLYSTLPVYLRDHGRQLTLYATLIAVGSGLILLLEIPVTMLLRRRSAPAILGIGYALVGAGMAMFGLGTAAGTVIAAMVVLTAGEILYKTTATAHVLDRAPDGLTGRYQGLYTAAATSGTMLAAPLGAALYGLAPAALWPVCAVAAAGCGILAWRSGRAETPATAPVPQPLSPA